MNFAETQLSLREERTQTHDIQFQKFRAILRTILAVLLRYEEMNPTDARRKSRLSRGSGERRSTSSIYTHIHTSVYTLLCRCPLSTVYRKNIRNSKVRMSRVIMAPATTINVKEGSEEGRKQERKEGRKEGKGKRCNITRPLLQISKYCSQQQRVAGSLFSSPPSLMSYSCKLQAEPATFANFHLFLSSSPSTIPLSLSPSFSLFHRVSLSLSFPHPFQHSLLFTVQPCFCRAENLRPCALSCNLGYAKGLERGGREDG